MSHFLQIANIMLFGNGYEIYIEATGDKRVDLTVAWHFAGTERSIVC